jgi:alginate O-acetyltransferase complex protein AlgI
LVVGSLSPARWRGGLVLVGSVIAIYWLQPSTPLRNWDFWLPTASLLLTVWVWATTRGPATDRSGSITNLLGVLLLVATIIVIAVTRYLGPVCCLTASRPPGLERVLMVMGGGAVLALVSYRLTFANRSQKVLVIGTILALLLLFIILKHEILTTWVSAQLHRLTGQTASLAQPTDLPWLGLSYLAFRLLHVLRDHQSGRLPQVNLLEFANYVLFFPAIVAGPIDRLPRFTQDMRKEWHTASSQIAEAHFTRDWNRYIEGGQRLLSGLFKKFALADTLALISLSNQNAPQVSSTFWMWVLLYAYSLRIYLDFSGYTDIAIGLGILLGIRLPENFDRPYLQQNLTAFWNSWHITLAQWFRAYLFNPLTRSLRSQTANRLPAWSIIFIGQFSTMAVIGLWHGLTWNFLIWGAWHGIGLFMHNRWVALVQPRLPDLSGRIVIQRIMRFAGWLLTFNYIALGWVWFALSSPAFAVKVFQKLFGG